MNKIDFVITWVDGSDEKWLEEKKKYNNNIDIDEEKCRYRDTKSLKYWFRAVEKYTPWVNKIYLITWGHLPDWINENNKKLVIINHKDYIPNEYLPTYNSNTIELNVHRIKDLEENFVLFNDDFFIINPMKKEDFFINDLPCEEYAENINMPLSYDEYFSHVALNNIGIINKKYKKRKFIKRNFMKVFNLKYGINNLRTLLLLPWSNFSLIYDSHLPVSIKKSYISRLWKEENNAFERTCEHRFREYGDINQYLIRYHQLLDGKFVPRSHNIGKMFLLGIDNKNIKKAINGKRYKMICINDSNYNFDFEKSIKEINDVFEKKLPNKSSFEK